MDAESARQLGEYMAAIAAALGTTWLALVRPLARRVSIQEEAWSPEQVQRLANACDALKATLSQKETELGKIATLVEQLQEDRRRLFQLIEKLEEKQARMVTDEEFATYVAATTENLRGLVEKLGNVCGQIEAWTRFQGGR